jgi:Predicted archaeal methyltransferase
MNIYNHTQNAVEIKLIEGNTMEIMPSLPAESFNLIVADPPYLVGEIPCVRTNHMTALACHEIDWNNLFKEFYRVLHNNATLLLFGHISTF